MKYPVRDPLRRPLRVAPFTGAWIEISCTIQRSGRVNVAPFTGAWIEMFQGYTWKSSSQVAPFTGAWIEIDPALEKIGPAVESHPSRVRGLKFHVLGLFLTPPWCRTLHGCVD